MMRLLITARAACGLPFILSFSRKERRHPGNTLFPVERGTSPLPLCIRGRMQSLGVASSPRRACWERGRGEGAFLSAGRKVGAIKLSRVLVPVLLCAAALSGCGDPKPAEPPPVRPVLYAVADPLSSLIVGPFAGSVEPRYKTQLGFRTFGRLIARGAEMGEVVKQGTRLAVLDPALQAAALRGAEADLASAEAQLANAAGAEGRQRALLDRGVTPLAIAELAQKNREAAASRVVQAQAELTKAKEQLSYTAIVADTNGVITAWDAEIGQVVGAGKTVVTIARPDVKEAVFDLPDQLIASLNAGATVEIALQLDPSIKTQGRVRELAPEADQATRNRRVKFALDAPPEAFRIGSTVTASLTKPISPSVMLPASALLEKDGKTSVWVIDPDKDTVQERAVIVSERGGGTVTITAGLNKGERVATAGVHSLAPGQKVRVFENFEAETKR
jgi:membrane fusion protein, multidrug efflux system